MFPPDLLSQDAISHRDPATIPEATAARGPGARCRLLRAVSPALLLWLTVAPPLAGEDPGTGGPSELWTAARDGDVAAIGALLDSGVPVDAPQRRGGTALLVAAGAGHLEAVDLLLERGADPSVEEQFWYSTPLMQAARGGHWPVVLRLLEAGAGPVAGILAAAGAAGQADVVDAILGREEKLWLYQRHDAARLTRQVGHEELAEKIEAAPFQEGLPVVEMSPEQLETYAGIYGVFGGGSGERVTVEAVEGGLRVRRGGQTSEVVPLGRQEFRSGRGTEEDPGKPVFFLVRAGVVDGITLLESWPPETLRRDEAAEDGVTLASSSPKPDPGPSSVASDLERRAPRPWPSFRGEHASGVADGQGAVANWNVESGEHVLWKTPVPGLGLSSPVVWGRTVYLTTAVTGSGEAEFRTGLYGDPSSADDDSEQEWRVLAYDLRTGEPRWSRTVARAAPGASRHTKASHASSTAATDGERVAAVFPTAGLVVLDAAGKVLWRKDLGPLSSGTADNIFQWGFASSPILWRDLVILQVDIQGESFLAAWDAASGEERWRVAREEISTWSTPTVVEVPTAPGESGGGPRHELVTNGTTVRAYDPATGEKLWWLGPSSEVIIATPIAAEGLVFVTAGYPPVRPIFAVRPGSRGELAPFPGERGEKGVAWSHGRGGGYMPTPLAYQGLLYLPHHDGRLVAYDTATGEMVYRARIGRGATLTGSPVAADGRIYFPSEEGQVFVARSGRSFELLATHEMGEAVMTTPAVSDGVLLIRGLNHLWGLGEREAEEPPASAGR
ncbi:MAG: PQQ-binding-like beta-propeller repeat protein [Holophagales bacterium]|nr:PQQ-binding-like beta-propeller repeat protein [Holophagales bacterium]